MKKLILAAFALTTAASVFAQGTILYNNNATGLRTRVYAPLAGDPGFSQIGNGPIDTPSGATSWAGFTLIGGTNLSGQYGANATLTTLLAGTGLGATEASLQPGNLTTSFKSGAGGGLLAVGITESYISIPTDYALGVTAEMVAWDNSSGNYATWTLASAAWMNGLIAAGESGRFNITAAMGGTGTPPSLPTSGVVQSFNLYFIPEPSTFALAGLGLAALVAFRRRNS